MTIVDPVNSRVSFFVTATHTRSDGSTLYLMGQDTFPLKTYTYKLSLETKTEQVTIQTTTSAGVTKTDETIGYEINAMLKDVASFKYASSQPGTGEATGVGDSVSRVYNVDVCTGKILLTPV